MLSNPCDAPEAAAARAGQEDPLVMYLVVRRSVPAGYDTLLTLAARACLACRDRYGSDPAWREVFRAWDGSSFRKVVLRAGEREWERLVTEEQGVVQVMDPCDRPLVAGLAPRARSARSALLGRLQVYGPAPGDLPDLPGPMAGTRSPTMLLVVNPALRGRMSAGKAMAQAGHAAMMGAAAGDLGADAAWLLALQDWVRDGRRIVPVRAMPAGWERALAELDGVVVVDRGLTEIEPGSRTVMALRPCLGEATVRCLEVLADGGA